MEGKMISAISVQPSDQLISQQEQEQQEEGPVTLCTHSSALVSSSSSSNSRIEGSSFNNSRAPTTRSTSTGSSKNDNNTINININDSGRSTRTNSTRTNKRVFQRTDSKLTLKREIPIIPSSQLRIQHRIGKGAFSTVFHIQTSYPLTPVVSVADSVLPSSQQQQSQQSRSDNLASPQSPESRSPESQSPESQSPTSQTSSYQHQYALKCLDTKFLNRKQRYAAALDQSMEADLLSRLDHENIIQLYGVTCAEECHSPASTKHCSHPDHFHIHHHHHHHHSHNDNENEDKDATTTTTTTTVLGHCLVLELLQETLQDRLETWRQKNNRRRWCSSSNYLCGTTSSRSATSTTRTSTKPIKSSIIYNRFESIVWGIVQGMNYLHRNGVIVRDLKPANIGFNSQGQVKLLDFGLAREVHELSTTTDNDIAGSLRYLAPECIQLYHNHIQKKKDKNKNNNNNKNEDDNDQNNQHKNNNNNNTSTTNRLASDVYSLSIVVWEICTLHKPYNQYTTMNEFYEQVVNDHERPSLQLIPSSSSSSSSSSNNKLHNLLRNCWNSNPNHRPTLPEIQQIVVEITLQQRQELQEHQEQERPKTRRANSLRNCLLFVKKKHSNKNKKNKSTSTTNTTATTTTKATLTLEDAVAAGITKKSNKKKHPSNSNSDSNNNNSSSSSSANTTTTSRQSKRLVLQQQQQSQQQGSSSRRSLLQSQQYQGSSSARRSLLLLPQSSRRSLHSRTTSRTESMTHQSSDYSLLTVDTEHLVLVDDRNEDRFEELKKKKDRLDRIREQKKMSSSTTTSMEAVSLSAS